MKKIQLIKRLVINLEGRLVKTHSQSNPREIQTHLFAHLLQRDIAIGIPHAGIPW